MIVYKALPDMLSLSRFGLALVLPLTEPLSATFLAILAVGCLTDVLDGYLARRFDACSPRGHTLDSIADLVLAVCLLYCIIPAVDWKEWMIIWIATIAAVRLISFALGSAKYGKAAFIHTYLNKAAGVLFFLSPFLLFLFGDAFTVATVCTVASISAAEYLYINICSEKYDPNYRSALMRRS
ncbi:MAG: CDP-alcohol phosphatidyltransferase family protein [Candidatus Methanomethylophilaceae archaeon]|nr:CDP-alcohol phosphatidyltransferase family protein [Candidatus Methanomethylophilaceae archaeon]